MRRQLTAWFLIFTVFAANFSWLLVYAGFKINQQYIAATLCENRNKPDLHCNGQCYLRKQLRQTEERQQHQSTKGMITKVEVVFDINAAIVPAYVPAASAGKIYPVYHTTFTSRHIHAIFRPPQHIA